MTRVTNLASKGDNMTDLTALAGLPVKFDEGTYHISFGSQVRAPLYSTREMDAIRPLLLDPDCVGPDVLYWMYRNLGLKGDECLLDEHRLRYDVSIFVPAMLGREYLKTSGHYHPPSPDGVAYPEVYEIWYGEALYLLQKVDDYTAGPAEVAVEDVITVRARPGDKVIMPPGYGHVTINTLDVPLVMCNWVCDDFSSYYQSVEATRGFASYLLKDNGEPRWIVNDRYAHEIPARREAEPRPVPELGLVAGQPMYNTCRDNPELFAFLAQPAKFEAEMWQGLAIV